MKKLNILYWIFTGLYAAFIILTAIPDVVSSPDAVKMIVTQLGYPAYFLPFVGVAKVLGGIVLLVPGFPRLKEWAYAGLVFDLMGALYSFIAIGLPASDWLAMLLFFAVLGASYFFYHKRLKALALKQAK